ncbi:MAG: glycoside hydrolase family 65 protein, partial [Bacilli bacterium]|nr:glycoside hydrolase family 65 protein [Bacilli bacterium]
ENNFDAVASVFKEDRASLRRLEFSLGVGKPYRSVKRVVNLVEKNPEVDLIQVLKTGKIELESGLSYPDALAKNRTFFALQWENIDIEITGDTLNQQGIRYCLFQLTQTYHGYLQSNNIGAKGLTGEAYSGHAFWDTETYCLPFYLFNDPEAAKALLLYRYNTLAEAKERAKELDCKGACFPIATLNGEESCDLWQHASLQMQPSTAVAYAVMHYFQNTKDVEFLFDYGIEMLLEISRYVLSRGDYSADGSKFGFYGVMGPDEFQMMVNHNAYTNYMGKNTLEDTIKVLNLLKMTDENKYNLIVRRLAIDDEEIDRFAHAAAKMYLPYDPKTNLFEQHQGYFDLPHVDVDKIPLEEFPLYHHWTYDRIYRNDMIKQPDVLMMMFLKNRSFTDRQKLANYEFYEPRCIHESSLSPSIHSVLAGELGKLEEATEFFGFATRLDLDNYNRNAAEGLHLTSIAAAWVNIVYGFGGLRSDGDILALQPKIPPMWEKYSFRFVYHGVKINVEVMQDTIAFNLDKDLDYAICINGEEMFLSAGTHRFTKDYRRITDEEHRTQGVSQE